MKKFSFIAIVLAGFMCVTLTACAGVLSSSEDLRYKITVMIDTPEGVKTGSAVREAHRYYEKSILPEQGGVFYSISKGEAVVIDLGQRGLVFGLWGDEWREAELIFNAFEGGQKTLPLEINNYPKFVRFKNINDPRTIENILDYKACPDPVTKVPNINRCIEKDHFEETFGRGVKLKSVYLEMTTDNVTWGVDRLLPYGKDKFFRDWFKTLQYGDPRAVSHDAFVKGKSK